MLTVVLACVGSGKIRTRRPLSSRYSVMPSTAGPCVTPGGNAAAAVHADATRMPARSERDDGKLRMMDGRNGKGAEYTAPLGGPHPVVDVYVNVR